MASPSTRFRATPDRPLLIPSAFRLPASNGFTLYVIAIPSRVSTKGILQIFAEAPGRAVIYRTLATVTETSMQADLGELGEISMSFERSNQPVGVRCGKETIRFDSGSYVGRIDFHGEAGYTSAEATAVPGDPGLLLSPLCGGGVFVGGTSRRPRGAELFVRNPALGPQLTVRKSRPGAAARITAWTREYNDGISITRYVDLQMPSKDFGFNRRLRTAVVSPPPPFSGSARFGLGKKAGQRWSGDLMVDLPGRSAVPLTGPALRATLLPSG